MVKAVIGLGSNLGDSKRHLMNAVKELNRYDGIRVTDISSLYLTKPVGPQDQNYFINAVAVIDTGYSARDLLDVLHQVENSHHRRRIRHWGERTLDLDILFFGNEVIDTEDLQVPHPEIVNRAFVIIPLLEIDSSYAMPDGRYLRDMIPGLPKDDLRQMRRLSYDCAKKPDTLKLKLKNAGKNCSFSASGSVSAGENSGRAGHSANRELVCDYLTVKEWFRYQTVLKGRKV